MAISKVNSPYTKIQDVPDVPTIGTATEGEESAEVAFTPATTGGRAYQYRALSSPGSIEAVGSSSPITVPGLTADTTYSFQVRAETNTGATNGYSSASNSIVPTSSGSYDLLETTILSSSASSVSFTGLGSYTGYKHLQVRVVAAHDSATASSFRVQFNSDTGNNYARHALAGNGSVVFSEASINQDEMAGGSLASNAANIFAPAVFDILDFSNTSKNTTIRAFSGSLEGASLVVLRSGLYVNTNAVTSIEIDSFSGVNLLTGSRFSLYGIKAA